MSGPQVLIDLGGRFGQVAIADHFPMVYRLTGCCQASAKGGFEGILCRACYAVIPDEMGDAWMVDEEDGWARFTEYARQSMVGHFFSDDEARSIAEGLTIAVRSKAERLAVAL